MKFHVFHLDRFSPCRPASGLKHGFIIESQPQLRHAAQVAFQFHCTQDLRPKDVAGRGDKEIKGLDDVEKDFIFAIPDAFTAP